MEIPKPDHKYGYTLNHLKTFMPELQLKQFDSWMAHQTIMMADNGEAVFYTYDVKRFMSGRRTILD